MKFEMSPKRKSIAIWRDAPIQHERRRGTDFNGIVANVVRAFRRVGYEIVVID